MHTYYSIRLHSVIQYRKIMAKKSIQRRVTGKDIAEIAGVSQSTVSRVLSSEETSSLISEETAQRIKQIAKNMGYSPNPIARALRGERTNLIGLIVREIADPFFAGVIEEINYTFKEKGFNVILGHVHSDPTEGRQITRILDSRQCDGMIFLGDLYDDMKYINEIREQDHPALTMCRGNEEKIPYVNCNNEQGTHLLVEHLLSLGHKNLAFIDGGSIGDLRERRRTFSRLEQNHPELTCTIIQAERNDFEGGFKAMNALLMKKDVPTAIMAADDGMAVGVLKAITSAGLRVPEDISVTGFDDIELSRYTIPALTTIRQPIEKMAEIAVDMLIKMIDRQPLTENEKFVSLEPELIIRDSSGPIKRK